MPFKTSIRILVLIAMAALLLSGVLLAQSLTQGAISGTVTDPTNAVLPSITVKLTSLDKGYTRDTTTNAQGVFQFALADPGPYKVEVSATGFKGFAAKATVNVGQTTIVNAKLEIGTTGTTVEVTGAAPLMETESADMTTSFDRTLVENMPNGGNDLTAIAYSAPGVVMNTGGGYGNFNVNGLPATSNLFTIDGENQMDPFMNLNNSGPTNLMLGKNSIEEATVVTNAYGGQYGQQAGAQVNYVSKGGTNQFHGNAQYEWTGRYLDANSWFNTDQTPVIRRPFANNNEYAASIGGPIIKDKTFFFVDYEGIRYIVPSTQVIVSPTPAFLADTLANLSNPGSPYQPASAATIAAYTEAASLWQSAPNYPSTPAAVAAATYAPASSCVDSVTGNPVDQGGTANPGNNVGGCLLGYVSSPSLPAKEWLLIGRIDQNISNKDRAFFRFVIDRGVQDTYADPINPTFSAASNQPSYQGSLAWSHTISNTATNQFIAALSWYGATFIENSNPSNSIFNYSLYVGAGENLPNSVVGLNAGGYSYPQGRNVTQYQFLDDFAKTSGRHNLKFGANFRRYDITNYDDSYLVTPPVFAGLEDYFSGSATEYQQNNPLHLTAPMNTGGFGIYAQDEWAVTSKLKLTAGLRAERNFNPTCDNNCFTLLNGSFASIETTQTATTPYSQALLTGRRDAFNSVDTINIAPRFGFTWSPRADSKTVISGGIGIFYDAFPATITDSFMGNPPYTVGVNLYGPDYGGNNLPWANNSSDPTSGGAILTATVGAMRASNPTLQSVLAAGGAPPNVTSFPGKLRTPQYQEWNLQVQQEIDSKSRISISYVGNHGILEAYPNSNLNACTSSGVFGYPACPTSGLAPVDQRFGTVTEYYSGAVSNSNGLTAAYNRRLTAGFTINANFTWAHAYDEISNGGFLGYGASSIQGQINPLNFRANNYGPADYDIRHSFNANYVWAEPFHFNNKILTGVLGGWTLSQVFSTRSGLPFTVTDAQATNQYGSTTTPAQATGPAQQSCRNGLSQCFNPSDFVSANGLSYFPTQTRDQYRGPNFFNADLTVGKGFQITERVKFVLGANIYNVFNHPNFQNPNGASNSGTISSMTAPPTGPYGSFGSGLPAGRMGQITGKITF
jgi:outer membrane receptor protein involved in Fe transport